MSIPVLETSRPARLASSGKPRVMFVDDEERILRSLRMMFKPYYEVMTTTSGKEAIEIARTTRVHVVVSDQRMPIMPGVEVLRQIREVSPRTMRLLLTGYADMDAIVGSVNDGEVYRYISKPWDPEKMKRTVGRAAEIALSLEDVPERVETTESPAGAPAERLLVVDPDPATAQEVREVVATELDRPHVVDWAPDLGEVFRILSENQVAVVLSEIRIGSKDISPLLKILKRHNPHVTTIVLTSVRDSGVLVELINEGQIFRFLPKPVRRVLLGKSIKAALLHYRSVQAAPRLVHRHEVEEMKVHSEQEAHIADRILGFIKRLGRTA